MCSFSETATLEMQTQVPLNMGVFTRPPAAHHTVIVKWWMTRSRCSHEDARTALAQTHLRCQTKNNTTLHNRRERTPVKATDPGQKTTEIVGATIPWAALGRCKCDRNSEYGQQLLPKPAAKLARTSGPQPALSRLTGPSHPACTAELNHPTKSCYSAKQASSAQ